MTQADAYDALARVHGACKPVARTIINSASDGDIIVSTVLLANGFGIRGGAFFLYETRVFGGRCDGLTFDTHSDRGLSDVIRQVISQHTEAVERVVDSYLD
jgi:hypothetical protein